MCSSINYMYELNNLRVLMKMGLQISTSGYCGKVGISVHYIYMIVHKQDWQLYGHTIAWTGLFISPDF